MACSGDTECRKEDISLNLTQEWLMIWGLIRAQDASSVTFPSDLHHCAFFYSCGLSLSVPSLPFPCCCYMVISLCCSAHDKCHLEGRRGPTQSLALSQLPEKPTRGWSTCHLITKWSFNFPFVAAPCMCKTAAKRWSGWASRIQEVPGSSHQIPSNAQSPTLTILV